MNRIITADASQVSASDFLRALTGDPNDISSCPNRLVATTSVTERGGSSGIIMSV
jgi:hypothetical protein